MSARPEIDGIHHVTLSVSDLDRSLEWYADVLGFVEVKRMSVNGLDKAMMRAGELLVTFVSHGDHAVAGPFDERSCGLDHLSLALVDRAALDRWIEHLDARGVTRGEVASGTMGELVAFRDPDNIALEFYTRS